MNLLRGLSAVIMIGSLASAAVAAEWHVAPNAGMDSDGSVAKPWGLAFALQQPAAVKPGDTIWLHGGIYHGIFTSTLKGTPEAPIIVRAVPGERAILDAGELPGLTLHINGSDTWYWDFEVLNSSLKWDARTTSDRIPRTHGPYIRAPRTKLINLIVHETGMGFGFWAESPDSEMYGCISYMNGYSNLAHGLYIQNDTGSKLIEDNIIFDNASFGIHGYGENGRLNNMRFEGNVSFNNGGLYRPDFGSNILLGGSKLVAENDAFVNNYTYYSPDVPKAKGSNNFGYHGGTRNLTLKNNWFITPADRACTFFKCENLTMEGNTFYGRIEGLAPADYPHNTYYDATARPTGVNVFVRPNKYEPGRAHVIIYNWDKRDKVEVDLSTSGLKTGDAYEIRDVQNLFSEPVKRGAYDGKPVTLPMTGLTIAKPVGTVAYPPVHTSAEFNCFVVLKAAAK